MESILIPRRMIMEKLIFKNDLALLERKFRTGNYEKHYLFESFSPQQRENVLNMINYYEQEKQLDILKSNPNALCEEYPKAPVDFYKKSFSHNILVLTELEEVRKENYSKIRDIVVGFLNENKIVVLISTDHFDKHLIIPERFFNDFILY